MWVELVQVTFNLRLFMGRSMILFSFFFVNELLLQPSISFLLQPSRYSICILRCHGGVDPKDLCVAVACLLLMLDVAKELLIFSCAEDCRFFALEPSPFLARRILR